MKRLSLVIIILGAFLFFPISDADAAAIWAKNVNQAGGWFDAEKDSVNTEDDDLCWAASAANILVWSGWSAGFTKKGTEGIEDSIFDWLEKEEPIDVGGWQSYAWNFWFTGYQTIDNWGDHHFENSTHKGFYTTAQYNAALAQSWNDDEHALETAAGWLQNDYGVGLDIKGPGIYHAITLWGIETNDVGDYIGVWITDSDNDKAGSDPRPNSLNYSKVSKSSSKLWWLDAYGAEIVEMDALKMAAVPEPSTMLLIASGLIALWGARRKFRR